MGRNGNAWWEVRPRAPCYGVGMGPAEKLDPVDVAFDNAPLEDLPVGEDDARLIREARAEVEAGARLIPHDEAMQGARSRFGT